MNALRQLADDLREKHLWPVVLALVVALVAIPLIVGRGSAQRIDGDVAAAPPAGAVANATPAVVLVGPPAVRSRPGKLRDPFRRAKKAKAVKESSSAASTPKASTTSDDADKGSGGSSKTESEPKETEPKPPPPPPAPAVSLASRSVYVTTARFTGPTVDYEHPVTRLAVFGDKESPAAQYVGVSRGGEYAIFLLGPAATAGGDDGACVVADSCRAIGLRRGDKLQIEVAQPGAAPRQYTLEVTALRRVERASRAAAERERERVAPGGRAAMHAFAEDVPTQAALSQLAYGPVTGTVALVRAP